MYICILSISECVYNIQSCMHGICDVFIFKKWKLLSNKTAIKIEYFKNRIKYTAKFNVFYFRDTNVFTYMVNKGGQEFIDDIVGLYLFFSESTFLFPCLRPCSTLKNHIKMSQSTDWCKVHIISRALDRENHWVYL